MEPLEEQGFDLQSEITRMKKTVSKRSKRVMEAKQLNEGLRKLDKLEKAEEEED